MSAAYGAITIKLCKCMKERTGLSALKEQPKEENEIKVKSRHQCSFNKKINSIKNQSIVMMKDVITVNPINPRIGVKNFTDEKKCCECCERCDLLPFKTYEVGDFFIELLDQPKRVQNALNL